VGVAAGEAALLLGGVASSVGLGVGVGGGRLSPQAVRRAANAKIRAIKVRLLR
jgi:hypothetical protein